MRVFLVTKLILVILKASLVWYFKSGIILNETKKPSGKSLRVWGKNQLSFDILVKILKLPYKSTLNGRFNFVPIFSPIFQDLIRMLGKLDWRLGGGSRFVYFHYEIIYQGINLSSESYLSIISI